MAGLAEARNQGMQRDGEGIVTVDKHAQLACHDERAAQFLADFAGEGFGRCLGRLNFAAGKFPESAEVLGHGPPGQQHSAAALDQGAYDGKGRGKGIADHPGMHPQRDPGCNF